MASAELDQHVTVFRSQARCRIAKAAYAPVSMTDLKVSVTASVGKRARLFTFTRLLRSPMAKRSYEYDRAAARGIQAAHSDGFGR